MRVFFAFRDAADRRAALGTPGALDRYRLFGLDEIAAHGVDVRHNLERSTPPWARVAGRTLNAALDAAGGTGGDFASVLPALPRANDAEVVFSTVDTVGIPLLLLKQARLLRTPLVYASIGLAERLGRLRNESMRRLFKRALASTHIVVAYAESEAEELRRWAPRVVFVPFGVDVDAFRPVDVAPSFDVVSVGADPLRDWSLLLAVADRQRDLTFRIVTHDALNGVPPNVTVERRLPLEAVRERYAQARVIALPVRENKYSGATTTLLQAMAMAKPVVVSRTAAIARGYELEDGRNCRLVAPGDVDAFENALLCAPDALGERARETAQRFSWKRYTDTLWDILCGSVQQKGSDP